MCSRQPRLRAGARRFFMREMRCSTRARTLRCCALSSSSALSSGRSGRLRGGTTRPVLLQAPSPSTVTPWQCPAGPESRRASASAVVPGAGPAVATTGRVGVHDPQPFGRILRARAGSSARWRTEPLDHPAHGHRRDAGQRGELPHGEVRAVVRGHRQHPPGRRKPPGRPHPQPSPPRSRTALSSRPN